MAGIPWYSLCAGVGLCAALAYARARLRGFCDEKRASALLLLAAAAFLIGAAVSNVANWFFFPRYLALPLAARIRQAGFTFYPGMIAAVSLIALCFRLLGLPVREGMGRAVGAFPLFHAIARVGCLIVGCCHGRDLGGFRFPSVPVEIAALAGIFALLAFRRVRHPCRFYFVSYAVYRFFAEFLRGDDRGALIPGCPLSVSQQISLAVLAGVLVWSLIAGRNAEASERKDGSL